MNKKLLAHMATVVGALTLVLVAGGTDSVRAEATFNPKFTLAQSSTEPETTSDSIVDLEIPSGDVNFAGAVAFIPGDWGIITGDQIPIGAKVGNLTSVAILGLINSACFQALEPEFDMLNASIDITDTVSWEDLDDNATRDYADDEDDDELLNAIEQYPDFVPRLFEGQSDLQPIRRSAGITPVAGIPVLLQFLVFPPGTLIDDEIPHNVELGFPSVTLLQNAGDPDVIPAPGAITDFCTPLTTHNEAFGVSQDNDRTDGVDESGVTLSVTPKDGQYTFSGIFFGQRDADGDGFENSLDTCPFAANDGSPRISYNGDADDDGLDSACDPNDSDQNTDEDLDGYLNRQDNCPLLTNGEESTNQHDFDRDQIGDICDPNPGTVELDNSTADGELIDFQITSEVTIGTGAGPAGPPSIEACGNDGDINKCWVEGWVPKKGTQPPPTTPSGPTTPAPTSPGPTEPPDGPKDDGSSLGLIIGIIAAAVVVVGGGGFLLMRRRGS